MDYHSLKKKKMVDKIFNLFSDKNTTSLLITLCRMAKGFVIQLQGKQQLCKLLLYDSLVGQCKYTTQHKGPFWRQFVDALELIFLKKIIRIVFSSIILALEKIKHKQEPS